ncbi:glycerophosphodiester phosphodiesterase family protein [Desulfonatronospira sp.]|uniref:glycerophosphodiester phosphodiesterase family protein n=1 Tax=Desulfonatronospira sp. TaxID=1962951 RepID=UPI0025C23340|nr:glycerophosphodiester phosphodiesterase family protein [Desulfonatronospira sp.]
MQIRYQAMNIASDLRQCFRPLFIYHLFFSILAVMLLAPASAWITTRVLTTTGQPMISHHELLGFLLSPAGLAWVLAVGTTAVLIIFIHHAGMIYIASRSCRGRHRLATSALLRVGRNLPSLLGLALIQVAAHLLVAAPFILIMGLAWWFLLGDYDPYFLISQKPAVFWVYCLICLPVLVGMLAGNGLLYLRWFMALPIILLEKTSPVKALKQSSRLAKGFIRRIAALVLGLALLIFILPGAIAVCFDVLGGLVLGLLPENFSILVPAVLLFISSYLIIAVLISFAGTAANSLLIFNIYRDRTGFEPPEKKEFVPGRSRLMAWSAEFLLLTFALGQAGFVVHSFFDFQDQVHISAHRGSSMQAPENTIPAIEQAIKDGADYVEIDVRRTADGVPVLLHDRDLRRVAGTSVPVWELDLKEVQRLDAGSWFHPRFAGVGIPTLEEVIEVVRDRAKLYLEIKPSVHTPDLTRLVVELLQEKDFVDQVLLGAMNQEILREAKQLEPDLRTSLFVHTAIGEPDRSLLDALGLRAAITTVRDIQQAHRHGHELHVWTVNDRREMSRFIDMGVDNIITDRPEVLSELLRERAELSNAELLLVKLRHWLRD